MNACAQRLCSVAAPLGAAAVVALVGCAARTAVQWPPPSRVALTPSEVPDADAVVLSKTGELRFLDDSDPSEGYELTVHAQVRILTPGGRHHGRVVVPLDHWTKLRSIAGRSYHADAGVGPAGELRAEGGSVAYVPLVHEGVVHYSDSRLAVFDIPGALVGRVVEYRYTIRSTQSFGISQWMFDGPVPVRRSQLVVIEPEGWKLIWGYSSAGQVGAFDPTITRVDGGRRLTWEQTDLPAVEPEPYGLPPPQLTRTLRLAVSRAPSENGTYGDWNAIGRFYRKLTQGLYGLSNDVQRDLAQYLSAQPGADEVEAIYRFVRDRIRYVAIYRGIEALKPHAAAAVYAARLGDCKDMATLLIALYSARGITAFPALVPTRSHGPFHRDVPTTLAFNHVVVAIPEAGSYRFADPTATEHPFSLLPWEVQGQQALVVKNDGRAEIVTLPVAPSETNRQEVSWHVRGDVAALHVRLSGQHAVAWRALLRARDAGERLVRAIEHTYASRLAYAKVTEARWEESPTPGADALTIRADVEVPHASVDVGAHRFIGLGQFLGVAPEVRVPAERLSPVELGHPSVTTQRLTVHVPADARIERLPARTQIQTASGSYVLKVERQRDAVVITRVMDRQAHRIPPGQLDALRHVSEAYAGDGRDAIVLSRGGVAQ